MRENVVAPGSVTRGIVHLSKGRPEVYSLPQQCGVLVRRWRLAIQPFFFAILVLDVSAVAANPVVNTGGVVNAASYTLASSSVAPGSIAAVFGTNLTDGNSCLPSEGCFPAFDTSGRLNTTMIGTRVTLNGTPVPIFYATPQQIGIQIPAELTGASATLQVIVGEQSSAPVSIPIEPFAPGIFSVTQDGKGAGVITHNNGTPVNTGNPAFAGEMLVIYATGLGQATPVVPTGAIPAETTTTLTKPTVTIDGMPAQVQFAGLSGCCVGLNQINVIVPANVHAGANIPVSLNIGGKQSNTATLAVAAALVISGAPSNSINFGDVVVGTTTTRLATFTNPLGSRVIILQANVTGTAFRGSGFIVPQVLGSGQAISFPVQVTPTSTGQITGTLSITTDLTIVPITVSLTGNGVAAVSQILSHSVDLGWDASTSVVDHYNVYRSTVSGGPYTKVNSVFIAGTAYSDGTVVAGQTYFYVATAADVNGVESTFSNEAKAVVPAK